MQLNQRARAFLQKYTAGLAESYGVEIEDTSRYFSLTDPKETALRTALLESVDFLNMITCADVDQLSGQVVSVGNPGLFTGRKKSGRFIRDTGVDGNEYKLRETDSGAALRWDLLSVWANSGNENEFFQRMQAFINESFALDMLRIGFNGQSAADTTDPEANPNGEDVNIGWHQIAKKWNGGSQVVTTPVTLDEHGDHKSLDSMASDLINTCIPQQFIHDPRLVVLVGADLVAAEQYRLYQAADRPTEKIAAQMLGSSIAGRPAMVPPFMPGKRMVVTMLPNLQILTQRNTRQRKAEFADDRKQFENKYLRNEGYALETPELYAAYDEAAVTIGKVAEPTEKLGTD
ncbi:major capsid protein [Xenorhabdus stockiae]|uniref:Major capsid protein n=1 Tax=Xenorhabdus stockiae TaxID=351614 RepID=A0A2D0KM01_9GAMM|nr:phage major capsid protein, P2 family [Xenorhabdus stockiae]PHM64450.1 major capsid protein [Xenorhabdus stockiae]